MRVTLYKAETEEDKEFILYLNAVLRERLKHTPIDLYLDQYLVGKGMAVVFIPGVRIDIVLDTDIAEYLDLFNLSFTMLDSGHYSLRLLPKEVFSVTGLRVPDIRNTEIRSEIRGR